mmetsp:Transcript_15529/g.44397  ORF Transcript_15529/g.44397 Transcript_15529/m.44397 type:complete len:318 (+) Transcript_15529:189-1142(+)
MPSTPPQPPHITRMYVYVGAMSHQTELSWLEECVGVLVLQMLEDLVDLLHLLLGLRLALLHLLQQHAHLLLCVLDFLLRLPHLLLQRLVGTLLSLELLLYVVHPLPRPISSGRGGLLGIPQTTLILRRQLLSKLFPLVLDALLQLGDLLLGIVQGRILARHLLTQTGHLLPQVVPAVPDVVQLLLQRRHVLLMLLLQLSVLVLLLSQPVLPVVVAPPLPGGGVLQLGLGLLQLVLEGLHLSAAVLEHLHLHLQGHLLLLEGRLDRLQRAANLTRLLLQGGGLLLELFYSGGLVAKAALGFIGLGLECVVVLLGDVCV